jgi:hypothetical protein
VLARANETEEKPVENATVKSQVPQNTVPLQAQPQLKENEQQNTT